MRTPCLVLLLSLLSLASPAHALRIFACEPEWGSLAEVLAGEDATVYVATHARQDVHRIEARPSLISKVRRADLVVCTGGGLESGWLPVLLQRGSNPKVQSAPGLFYAADQVDRLEVPQDADRSKGDLHIGGNPHVHLDPHRILTIAEALRGSLAAVDPDNAVSYARRFEDFATQWRAATARWEEHASVLRGKRVIVHHAQWVYLNEWLGLVQVGSLEPLPGLPPTTRHLSSLIDAMERDPAYAILRGGYADPKPSEWLAKRTGICPLSLPYTVGGSEEAKDLFSLFGTTIDTLLSAEGCPQ